MIGSRGKFLFKPRGVGHRQVQSHVGVQILNIHDAGKIAEQVSIYIVPPFGIRLKQRKAIVFFGRKTLRLHKQGHNKKGKSRYILFHDNSIRIE